MVGATYRIQLSPSFGFDAAAAVAPYLATLGVTHVYTSPYLQAVPGSTHGYDVADPTRLSDDLGGPAAHRRMLDAFAAAGLGHVVDVVPNHMATHPANAWWWDVLENGQASPYAATSTSTGIPPTPSCGTRSCWRCWATTTGGSSTGASWRWRRTATGCGSTTTTRSSPYPPTPWPP